jgi:hypothetical protein
LIRYFFDVREGEELFPDDEGMVLATQADAEAEAARTLVQLSKDTSELQHRSDIAIEVRTEARLVFQVALVFEANKTTLQ